MQNTYKNSTYTLYTNYYLSNVLNTWARCVAQSVCYHLNITIARSFLRQILPNSAGQFAKFRGSPLQNCSNSMAYSSHPFVFWKLSIVFSFQKCNLSSHIVFIYDCVPYYDGY